MDWANIYGADANPIKAKHYIHSNVGTFTTVYDKANKLVNIKKVENHLFETLEKIIMNMLDREISFYELVEKQYVNDVNSQLPSGSKYKDIYHLYQDFQILYKKRAETTVLSPLIKLSSYLEDYRQFLKKVNSRLEKNPGTQGMAKSKGDFITPKAKKIRQEINKELKEHEKNIEWMEDFLEVIIQVYEFVENGILVLGDPGSKIDVSKIGSVGKLKNNYQASIDYAKREGIKLSQAETHQTLIDLLGKNASYFDFLDAFAIHAVPKDFIDLTTALQTSSRLGEVLEDLMPELLVEESLKHLVLPFQYKGKEHMKALAVGTEWSNDNITDVITGEVTVGGQTIKIGMSLKLKAEDVTRNSYVLPNIWTGKIEGFKTDEEKELFKDLIPHKDLMEWIKNNFLSLKSFSVDDKQFGGKLEEDFQDLVSLETKLGSWILLPRFFNGFLKEIEEGKFGVYKGQKLQEAAFTLFIISGDKVYLTTELLKNIRNFMITEYQGSSTIKGNVLSIRRITNEMSKGSKSQLEKLYKRKQDVLKTLEKVTYGLLMGDQEIANILSNINMQLSGEALIKSVEYEMNFAKAKGLK